MIEKQPAREVAPPPERSRATGRGQRFPAALLVAACAALPILVAPAWAQSVQGPGFRPGTESQQLTPLLTPRTSPEISIPEGTGETISEEAESIKLTLMTVIIEGSTIYTDEDLEPLYDKLLGRRISEGDVYRLAAAITDKYRADGYMLSRAVIPAQRIAAGFLDVMVFEGYIDAIEIHGGSPVEDRVKADLDDLLKSRPVKGSELQHDLQLVNDIPGVTARTSFLPSGQPDASKLVVTVHYVPTDAGK
jgi:hemolysin activation/secretion protein